MSGTLAGMWRARMVVCAGTRRRRARWSVASAVTIGLLAACSSSGSDDAAQGNEVELPAFDDDAQSNEVELPAVDDGAPAPTSSTPVSSAPADTSAGPTTTAGVPSTQREEPVTHPYRLGALGGFGHEYVRQIAADADGNIYLAGSFEKTLDLDPGPGVEKVGGTDDRGFVVKLGADFDYRWGLTFEEAVVDIAALPGGDLLVENRLRLGTDLDPGPGIVDFNPPGRTLTRFTPQGEFVSALELGDVPSPALAVAGDG
ncbi:MAG: hypothetical protein AAFP84_22690, partial [Actinomycetota bacterium]